MARYTAQSAVILTTGPFVQVLVIGVESTSANAMAQSLAEGQRITLSKVDAFADGTAVKQVGRLPWLLCPRAQPDLQGRYMAGLLTRLLAWETPFAHTGRPPALAWLQVGQETLRLCQKLVDGVVLVDNAACSAAIRDVFNETRSILEPSGALAVAGASAYLQRQAIQVPVLAPACAAPGVRTGREGGLQRQA